MTATERPIRAPRATPAARITALLLAGALVSVNVPARAQRGPPIIRDAEIEQLLKDYTQPLLKTAGLAQQNIRVVIINDRTFNAFVADGRRIFVNGGALMELLTPNQIIGVLAHETAHIAGGHLARLREQLANASTQSIIAMILGVGAMVAAGRSGNTDLGQVGAAAISAPTAVIQNTLFSYLRAQEDQADRAAVKFLTATGQSAKGMHETFKRLADQTFYQMRGANPYMMSHPLPSERVTALEGIARASPYWDSKDAPALQARHDLMRAKLFGFLERPDSVARRYPGTDATLAARYARAISAYRFGAAAGAIAQIDALIQAQPQNPYFHELKGQALLEAGKAAEAIAPLRQAIKISNSALVQIMLGQALIATHDRPGSMKRYRSCRRPRRVNRNRRKSTATWRWPMARRTIWRTPTWLPRERPSPAATTRPRAKSRRGPNRASRSALRGGSRPTTSRPTSRRKAHHAIDHGRMTMMKPALQSLAAALCVALLALPTAAPAQSFNAEQRGEIERIIKDYLLKNPELLQEVMAELERRQTLAEAEKHRTAVKQHSATIFNSPRQVTIGNPQGDVTVVEFFDYNCGYCKRAMVDMLELLKADSKIRFVLKEFPVLGDASVQTAQVAAAVRMQDKTGGKKYLEFHQKLLTGRGQTDKARALAVAKEIGLDVARIERDIAGEEVKATLDESFKLAEALGLNGTPSYVIGSEVVIGAVGVSTLKEKVNVARCGKATC